MRTREWTKGPTCLAWLGFAGRHRQPNSEIYDRKDGSDAPVLNNCEKGSVGDTRQYY